MLTLTKVQHEGKRVETGPVQFGDDWPGVFIRGDNALMGFAPALQDALSGKMDIITKARLQDMLKLMLSADKRQWGKSDG